MQELNYQDIIKNPKWIFWMNVARVLLLLVAIIILVVLVRNIEEVKTLSNDACALCTKKTGASCYIELSNSNKTIIEKNVTDLFDSLKVRWEDFDQHQV